MDTKEKKIIITGGHLTPALITAHELQANGFKNLIWVGRKYVQAGDTSTSPEFQLVSELNIPFIHLETGKLWRKWNSFTYSHAFKDLILIPIGLIQAFLIILKEKPDLVMSFGGYVALPLVIAAKLTMKKVITHEQVLNPGLANKIISFLANKILISWEQSEKYFPKNKTILTGNPSWVSFNKKETNNINFNNELPTISIIGGNQGSHILNNAVFVVLEDILKNANVIHQTGRSEVTKDKYRASEFKGNLSPELANRYIFQPYIIDDIFEIFDKSDLIVARGGANTMTDIILKAKKSIIIPIPWSAGQEQLKNAQFLQELGLASIIEYKNEINPESLFNEIKKRLKDEQNHDKERVKKLQNLIRYSGNKIVKIIEEQLTKNSKS